MTMVKGKERISIEKVAPLLGTIPPTVVTFLTGRVPRLHKRGEVKKRN